MRVNRTMQFLTIVVTFAACSTPADSAATPPDAAPVAAAPVAAAPVVEQAPVVALNVRWDSGPIDLAYRHEHDDLVARHSREMVTLRAGETAASRRDRQESENKTLELRYKRGKESHARVLPPS
jgi:hypothetical protein